MDKIDASQIDSVNRVIEAYVKTSLEQAHEAFKEHPSGANWVRLERAMLVYQQLKIMGEHKLSALPEIIWPLPIGNWADNIVLHASGRTLDDILSK